MNYFRTFLLMTGLTMIFMLVGDLLGGSGGMLMAFWIAIGMNFLSYWFSDKIVLAMYGAKEIKKDEMPGFYEIVRDLTLKTNMPMPRLYLIDTPMANAFATGRSPSHAAVAVTTGIMKILNERQLTAVLAHELTHVRNRDILISTIAASFAGAITILARLGFIFGGARNDDRNSGGLGALLMLLLAPVAAMLIQLAISRSREYAADNGSAVLTGHPEDLINALENLHAGVSRIPAGHEVHPATAHMFIVNPFKGDFLASMFSTHPTLKQRKQNLRQYM